jgi:glyoxylase-like metal-dependent hydrolase (beta-lactamase superfamily II)
MFDEILTSHRSAQCLRLEYEGLDGFREQNPLHKPYINMCKTLTMYRPVSSSRVTGLWGTEQPPTEPLTYIGTFDFEELHFDVYEGQGGHLPGEVVLIDRQHRLVFTGDVFINVHGLTAEQAEYNQFAPILMTSVDTDPKLCAQQRKAILQLLGDGEWQIFGSHGSKKNIE